ncbi:MAG: signal recognition particle protein [Methanothrix sp.]|jgi:signal recognition particle subunit SRP54|uniref:Signal recognition particle 54 kDa protein n=1 Tax=Methanothrix thermoacetophila (strain DSM 6194 / JCM 14653 / NBRC 101360 / PT) TaxID=349307 RepID=SRP54_METTP|nr:MULTISPECIES: signal recognition particle protein Srp54 [Methanothrix]A0B638.1 RecName: Full=Signal recognition particle 54 kDa protein; Short=SRP54 [Methanothrix thermoacetophila PT]ABK14162.1 signal recognition particle subunit FFH/SRP54 (srp54) [Methanothrix thermoacetophila PT]MBC7079739.1 signal recognition particle protein [Methanothrix sp.]NPU87814.1 signal recognition particle protein [Methanothrix sp.]
MVLDNLGGSLRGALKKIASATRVDKALVDDAVRDIQRALLQADVNVKLVMSLSNRIRERALNEKPPAGMNPREHVINIVYQELINLIGRGTDIPLKKQTIMLVGLQGSGKTTTAAKLATYFQRRGLRTAVICADTFRAGAYDQLKALCDRQGIFFYGEKGNENAPEVAKNGLEATKKYDVRIVDTAGRHALESDLIQEMKDIHAVVNADHKLLVMDAAIGQQASEQARAFNEAVGITGVIITKLDGTAKGGGALSAVAETKTSVAFIGVGETASDLEKFEADRFISRLLGMGDIKGLIEKAQEVQIESDVDVDAMMKGKFTLKDMYKQLEAMNKMGPLKQIMQMLPFGGIGIELSDKEYQVTKERLEAYRFIMDSMTDEELEDPKIINASRIKRIARGSGTRPELVKELLKSHAAMQKAIKGMRGGMGRMNMKKLMKRLGQPKV